MKEKFIKVCSYIFAIAINFKIVYAADISEELYNINDNKLFSAGTYVACWLIYAGIVAAVIMLMIKGIKYITSSPEGKGEVKKEIIPWFVGIVLLFSINTILQFIANFSQENINNLTI